MNKVLVGVGVLVLLAGAAVVMMSPKTVPTVEPTQTNTKTEVDATPDEVAREIVVTGKNFEFSVSEIKVKLGERVRIVFKNEGGFHDFVIDELNVRTNQLGDGEQEEVEFVADTVGTFEYYCSVGEHRSMGMKGVLKVE